MLYWYSFLNKLRNIIIVLKQALKWNINGKLDFNAEGTNRGMAAKPNTYVFTKQTLYFNQMRRS